jgi:hypothetical protein
MPHFTARRAYYNTNLFYPTRPPSESVLKRVPPEGSGYRGTMVTHNTVLSFPAPLYTLATFLLTSLGLSLPPYPYFTKSNKTHADVTDPDPSRPARQVPDTVDIPFFTVTPARRLVSFSPWEITRFKRESHWQLIISVVDIGNKHKVANISANFRKHSKQPQWETQGYGAGGLNYEKNLKTKIACQTPFNEETCKKTSMNCAQPISLFLYVTLTVSFMNTVCTSIRYLPQQHWKQARSQPHRVTAQSITSAKKN